MAIFNTESRQLLGKLETVPGTAEVLASVDADVRVRNLELSTLAVEYDNESAKYLDGTHTRDIAIAGVARAGMDFGIKLAPGVFEYNATVLETVKLPYEKYMKAAGLIETVSNPTDEATVDGYWTFTPGLDGDLQPATMAIYDIEAGSVGVGIEYKMAGAMGTMTIESESAGKPYMLNFAMQGKVDGVAEVAHVSLPLFDDDNALSTIADKMLNTVIRITRLNDDGSEVSPTEANEFCVNAFSLDTGLTITEVMCQADASGIQYYTITERDPRVTIDPLLDKISDFDFWTALTSEETYKLEIIGQQMEIVVPRAQIITADGSDDNGLRRNSLTMRPLKNLLGSDSAAKQADYSIKIKGLNKDVTP